MSVMLLWCVLAGAFAGVCAGLFGVGGGMIIVPALVWIFTAQGYAPEAIVHMAVGTSLATIVVTSISSLTAHHKRGAVRWDIWRNMTIGLVIGSLLGAAIAEKIQGNVLQLLIGTAAILIGLKLFFAKANLTQQAKALPQRGVQIEAGFIIGTASAIFGIGGGSLTVPFLNYAGLKIQQAVGTSAACGLPIAIAGAIGFAYFGSQSGVNLPVGTLGFVHITAFVCVSITSFMTAKLGAKLAHALPAATLKRCFGILLLVAGGQLIVDALRVIL